MSRLMDDDGRPTVELAVIFTGVETGAAYKIVDPATDEEHWIPFSQTLERHGKVSTAGEGTIVITEWIARQKGLIK